jgi:hypothetical protein
MANQINSMTTGDQSASYTSYINPVQSSLGGCIQKPNPLVSPLIVDKTIYGSNNRPTE